MTAESKGPLRRLSGLYYGWRMIGLVALIRTIGGGLHGYGFTVFFLPISTELGISRAATSLAFSLARAEGAIEGPLAGYLVDRFGTRPVLLTAALLCGLGYILLSWVDSYTGFLITYLGVISLTFTPGFMIAPAVLANSWFIRHRARAFTCLSAAMPIGGVLITPLLAIAVQNWGWRWAAILTGCLFLFVAAPLTYGIRRTPESMGLLPDGDLRPDEEAKESPPGAPTAGEDASSDYTIRQAMRSSVYWLFIFWMTARTCAFAIVIVHFVPLMVWKGLAPESAAFFLSFFAFANLAAHFVLAWIADRVNKPRLVTYCMALALISVLPLIQSDAVWGIWLFTTLFALVDAAIPVMWATVGDFFGRKSFGTIRGTMSFFYMWGSFIGPIFAGYVYDREQSYTLVLWALVALMVVASIMPALLIKPWAANRKRG